MKAVVDRQGENSTNRSRMLEIHVWTFQTRSVTKAMRERERVDQSSIKCRKEEFVDKKAEPVWRDECERELCIEVSYLFEPMTRF